MTIRRISEVPLPDREIIELVRHSCVDVPEGSVRLARSFYDNLFEMVPSVRDMFSADIRPQQQRMADALLSVVRHLDDPDEVALQLRRLGRQHQRDLGVKPEHYPYVGRALVRAVSEVSPTWSSSMSSAWVLVYQWVTAHMLAGAEEAAAPPPPARSRSQDPVAAQDPAPARHRSPGRSGERDPYREPGPEQGHYQDPYRDRGPSRYQDPGRGPERPQEQARYQDPDFAQARAAGRGPR
ncbi:globin domain-containing protein [Nocardiopsis flavescens]|uniref:globin domain-containing protein n=1 Tax=Nocardiopsis flavescens TaxID=758803 RepID=UPI003654320C